MDAQGTHSFEGRSVFILSLSSDIGTKLALDFLARGARVAGTHRSPLPEELSTHAALKALECDLSDPACANLLRQFFQESGHRWDIFVSCVGQLAPVGSFFSCNFEDWARSVEVNSLAQLRALHAAYPFRHDQALSHVVFFAGGGTNNPFPSYSAYCLGKIALIKMCELIDDENPDLNAFIVGTGWVNTKIHRQTLQAGDRAGDNLGKTRRFINDGQQGTSHREIAEMILWGISQGREVAGGRNFSIVHDAWRNGGGALADSLRNNKDKFRLRRHGNT